MSTMIESVLCSVTIHGQIQNEPLNYTNLTHLSDVPRPFVFRHLQLSLSFGKGNPMHKHTAWCQRKDQRSFHSLSHSTHGETLGLTTCGVCVFSTLFTWSSEHFIEQAFAERQRGSVGRAVGPTLTDRLEQERLGPGGLDSEVGKLKNTLVGGDRRPFAPAKRGTAEGRRRLDRGSCIESGYTNNNK